MPSTPKMANDSRYCRVWLLAAAACLQSQSAESFAFLPGLGLRSRASQVFRDLPPRSSSLSDNESESVLLSPSFEKLGLSPDVVSAVGGQGWESPTPIQNIFIPEMLSLDASSQYQSIWSEALFDVFDLFFHKDWDIGTYSLVTWKKKGLKPSRPCRIAS